MPSNRYNKPKLASKKVPLENFSTIRIEKSRLPVKGFELWALLGTHGHWAVMIHNRATPTVICKRYIHLYGHPRGLLTLANFAWFKDLGLSRTGIDPRLYTCEANAPPTEPLWWFFQKEKTFPYLTSVPTLRTLFKSV